ncbi:MAG: four helix bundle protein [Bacteroidales bacterium]|nr:four helix bundle protein [Bacteroidales bacterium]
MFSFQNLQVWHESRCLVTRVYRLVGQLPIEERFALSDQLRRAVVSIPTNIAEGTSRFSDKEKAHFIEIAYGSLCEVYSLLVTARDLDYITDENLDDQHVQIEAVGRMLCKLRSEYLSR